MRFGEQASQLHACRDNLLIELAKHGMSKRDVVPNLNFFAGPGTLTLVALNYDAIATVNITRSVPTVQFANTVVIPDDGGGPVQIIFESSTDLITWTAANPGTYGTTNQKRFFRLRAVRQ